MDDTTLRELLLTPPDEFVAARNERAKRHHQAGERDVAKAIAAVRRPAWVDWALNTASDASPDDVAAFADAADAMRAAQADAVAGHTDGVAAALREVRARTSELARLADGHLTAHGRTSELAGLVQRVTEVAASSAATDRLRNALLRDGDEAPDEPGPEPDPEPAPAPSPRSRSRTKAAPAASTPRRAPGRTTGADEQEVAAAQAAARRELVRLVAERERAVRTAEHHVSRAEHALAEAASRRDLAAGAVARAQSELDRATARAESAEVTVAELRASAAMEAAALADLRVRLDALAR